MLFSLTKEGENDNNNSSSHSSHSQIQREMATVTPVPCQAKPLFQVKTSASGTGITPPTAPLFTKRVTAHDAAVEVERVSSSSSPTTVAIAGTTSTASSSASNSQTSLFDTHNLAMNVTNNNNLKAPRRFTLASAHSSTPDLLFSSDTATSGGIAFPTLLQVKQQSQSSQSIRRLTTLGWTLSDTQKATLDRVARLAARITGVPVAMVTNLGIETTTPSSGEALLLSHYGLTECAWRAQALNLLKTDPEVQRTAGLAFYQHVPITTPRGLQRLGSLTLMSTEARPSLTVDERQDLEDLTFLAAQALMESPSSPTTPTLHRRQVSNTTSNSSSESLSKNNRRRRRTSSSTIITPLETIESSHNSSSSSSSSHNDHTLHEEVHTPHSTTEEDPSKCIIACTAHDLLTPLMGLQLSLSLLQEDAKFVRHLEEQPLQRESFWTAWQSTEVMFRMCQTTIDTLRANKAQQAKQQQQQPQSQPPETTVATELCNLDLTVLLHSLQRLMDPIPKQVPLILTLQGKVPNQVPIVTTSKPQSTTTSPHHSTNHNTVDWNILRCALTVLSHACRVSSSSTTSTTKPPQQQPIRFNISILEQRLVMECHHDYHSSSPDVEDDLALQSVAHQMQSVYGGQHGLERRQQPNGRGLFWFSVPIGTLPCTHNTHHKNDRVITLLPQQQQPPPLTVVDELPGLAPMWADSSEPTTDSVRRNSTPLWLTETNKNTNHSESPTNFRGLRRWRRSSTGSTNTLGGRRRTFHDMEGLSLRTNQIPALIPSTMVKAQSTIVGVYNATASSTGGGRNRNYEFPSSCKKLRRFTTTNNTVVTAQTAMAAAFQAGLNSGSAADLAFGMNESSRLSYSILKEEEEAMDRERLTPHNLMSASNRSYSSHHNDNNNGSGLDRCFKDLMGASASAVDNVRERLYNRASSSCSSLGGSTSKPSISGTQRERKALVIEDSLVIRKTVARALAKLGIQTVVQANDGLEGIARMQEDVFDITLCDFSMPNLGGIDCVKQYRQWERLQSLTRPKQYIVGMSAHACPNDIAQGLQVGMNEYHPKPLTIKRLSELLESSPLQQTRCELDREWQRKNAKSLGANSLASPSGKRPSLFDDFTKSTVTMLDAMSSSQRSQVSFSTEDPMLSKRKRPETGPLFSISAITSS